MTANLPVVLPRTRHGVRLLWRSFKRASYLMPTFVAVPFGFIYLGSMALGFLGWVQPFLFLRTTPIVYGALAIAILFIAVVTMLDYSASRRDGERTADEVGEVGFQLVGRMMSPVARPIGRASAVAWRDMLAPALIAGGVVVWGLLKFAWWLLIMAGFLFVGAGIIGLLLFGIRQL